jgi:hypothetical protein
MRRALDLMREDETTDRLMEYGDFVYAAAHAFADQECEANDASQSCPMFDRNGNVHGDCRAALRAEIRGERP